ncbi:MAG: hypothetical protein ACK5GN_04710 [Pseudomonadota bacterium]|jgi:hypothetical protein
MGNNYLNPKIDFEFALRALKITILGALATQFHEISGLGCAKGALTRMQTKKARRGVRLRAINPPAQVLQNSSS